MEKDDETYGVSGTAYDFGARIYSSRLGRWLAPDPEAQFVASQYLAFANNPVLFVDPDGGWVPGIDSEGNISLTAEKGDDLTTLVNFFGDRKTAIKYISAGMVYSKIKEEVPHDNYQFKEGRKVRFRSDNNFSRAAKDAATNSQDYLSSEDFRKYFDGELSPEERKQFQSDLADSSKDNYNCHSCAINASEGDPLDEDGVLDISDRDKKLDSDYNEVGEDELKFGETIVTFGPNHDATFFGKDSKGNTYIFTKNGPSVAPTISRLDWLEQNGPYGEKRHHRHSGHVDEEKRSGYYNKKE